MELTGQLEGVEPTSQPVVHHAPQTMNFTLAMNIIVIIIFIVGIVGIPSNILTICVYSRLGFVETIHISYVALAVSDLGVVLSAVWCALLALPEFVVYMSSKVSYDVHLMVLDAAAWTHVTFSRSTALITAWVSLERCICVLFPMKVKTLITRRLTISIITVIYLSCFTPFVMTYGSHWVEWQKQVKSNSTDLLIIMRVITPTRQAAYLMTGTIYPTIYYFFLTTCTTLLIIKLRQNSQWRARHSSAVSHSEDNKMLSKQDRLVKTVVILASAFVIFSLPHIVSTLVSANFREYSAVGSAKEVFRVINGIVYIFHEINSSTNIFVYAFLGTKFRETLVVIVKRKVSSPIKK